jgi:ribonuclease HI
VDGELVRHATWPECEGRVKGVKWCKFKKVFTDEEEAEVLKGWGL